MGGSAGWGGVAREGKGRERTRREKNCSYNFASSRGHACSQRRLRGRQRGQRGGASAGRRGPRHVCHAWLAFTYVAHRVPPTGAGVQRRPPVSRPGTRRAGAIGAAAAAAAARRPAAAAVGSATGGRRIACERQRDRRAQRERERERERAAQAQCCRPPGAAAPGRGAGWPRAPGPGRPPGWRVNDTGGPARGDSDCNIDMVCFNQF